MARAMSPGVFSEEASEVAKKGSWFFEGYEAHYEIDQRGKRKKVLTYVGPRYGMKSPRELARARRLASLDVVVLTLLLLLINFFPGTGGMVGWVGAPCLWALIPLMFLYIGLFNFLTCKDKWEIRQFYAGYRRLGRWAIVELVLMAYVTAAHAVYLVHHPGAFPGEVYYTLGALACAALSGLLLALTRKCPAIVVEGPVVR